MGKKSVKFLALCVFFTQAFPAGAQKRIYFNPAVAGAEKQSKFVEIINYIPLQNTPTPINSYNNLFITKKYFVVFEFSLKRVSFFTRQGKFVKKTDLKKYGQPGVSYDEKNEQLHLFVQNKNYALTTKDQADIKANYALKKNSKYYNSFVINLEDPTLEIKKAPTNPYRIIGARSYYDSLYYISGLAMQQNTDSIAYEFQLLKDYTPVKSFFPFNRYTDTRFKNMPSFTEPKLNVFGTDTANVKYLARLYEPAIYRLNGDSIQRVYEFILPLDISLPSSFFEKGFKSLSDRENFQGSNGKLFNSFTGFENFTNYFFINVGYMQRRESFIFEKTTGKFYKSSRIKADSSQYNLSLLANGLSRKENGIYYSIVKASDLVGFYQKNKAKNIAYPPALEAFFKNATNDANPVIVVYKIKD